MEWRVGNLHEHNFVPFDAVSGAVALDLKTVRHNEFEMETCHDGNC